MRLGAAPAAARSISKRSPGLTGYFTSSMVAVPERDAALSDQGLEAGAAQGGQAIAQEDVKYPVKPGDIFAVEVPAPAPAVPRGQDIPLTILHEDEEVIVIDKPAGLVVHPGAGNPDSTLVNALIAHCGAAFPASAAWPAPASCTASIRTRLG